MPIIAVDGTDGSSKTTQARLLYDYLSIDKKLNVELCQMPGSTALGAELRRLVKSKQYPTDKRTERLIFLADFAQFIHEKVGRASEDRWFVCDRFNIITDFFYAIASGITPDELARLHNAAGVSLPCDMYIVLQLPFDVAMQRKNAHSSVNSGYGIDDSCRIESKGDAYLSNVAALYNSINTHAFSEDTDLEQVVHQRAKCVRCVDANMGAREVANQIKDVVERHFFWTKDQ